MAYLLSGRRKAALFYSRMARIEEQDFFLYCRYAIFKRKMKKIIIAVCLVVSAVVIFAFNGANKQQSTDYQLVQNNNLSVFQSEVQRKLSSGWKLAGGATQTGSGKYIQAIYK